MPEPIVAIMLEEGEHRRWVAAAGRAGQPVDRWVRDLINRVVDAERAGRRVAVMRELIPPTPPQEPRKCEVCGQALSARATSRRLYCSDACRVRAWRRRKAHKPGPEI